MNNYKPTIGQSTKTAKKFSMKSLIIIGLVLITAILLVDVFKTGYIKYSIQYAICGQAPVIVSPESYWTHTDYYSSYAPPGGDGYIIRVSNHYYCTTKEARDNGLDMILYGSIN